MIKKPITNQSYESPTTRVIFISPMRCIAGSNGKGQLQVMDANELYDEDF